MLFCDVTVPSKQLGVGMRPVIVEDFFPRLDITNRSDGQLLVSVVDMSLDVVSNFLIIETEFSPSYVELGVRI